MRTTVIATAADGTAERRDSRNGLLTLGWQNGRRRFSGGNGGAAMPVMRDPDGRRAVCGVLEE